MSRTPPISVTLPVYNAERYLSSAIESILQQTFKDFELIISDDCSQDSSWEIIQQYAKKDKRIKAKRNKKNLNGCENLNSCIRLAKGAYIARADNDDLSYLERLAKQYQFMETHPEVGILGGTMELIDDDGSIIGKRIYNKTDPEIREKLFRYSPFSHPLVMIRKSVLDQVGLYNVAFAPADDYELYFRIGKVSKFANLPDILLQYRVVKGSMTHRLTRKMELATIRVRNKYSSDPEYHMSIIDKTYTFLHYCSIYTVPPELKIRLFNFLRDSKN